MRASWYLGTGVLMRNASRSPCRGTSVLALLLASTLTLAAAPGGEDFHRGLGLYESGNFEAARAAFARAVEASPETSEYHHWLGKAHGRIAEQVNFLSAIGHARRARDEFERAVALDGDNRDALASLAQYYEEAPGFLGGSDEKARDLRRRIEQLDAARPPPAPDRLPTP